MATADRDVMRLSYHNSLPLCVTLATVLWFALVGSLAQAGVQHPAANESQADYEEVFSLSGFGDGSNAADVAK